MMVAPSQTPIHLEAKHGCQQLQDIKKANEM
jgi:hypothetical protein